MKSIQIYLIFAIICCLLIRCQGQETITKILNLLEDESVSIYLDDYYQFPATLIEIPTKDNPKNQINPIELFSRSQHSSQSIRIMASCDYQTQGIKYFLDLIKTPYDQSVNLFNLTLAYYSLTVNPSTHILERGLISQITIMSNLTEEQIRQGQYFASFYAIDQFFINFNITNQVTFQRYQYNANGSFTIVNINNELLREHVSFKLSSEDTVYIIHVDTNQMLNLLKYDIQLNSITLKDQQNITIFKNNFQVLITQDHFFIYDEKQNRIVSVNFDYASLALIRNEILLPNNQNPNFLPESLQKLRDTFILTFRNVQEKIIIKIKEHVFINGGELEIKQQTKINLSSSTQLFFFEDNYFASLDSQNLSIINLNTKQAIFTKQMDQYSFLSELFIGNQIYLTHELDSGEQQLLPVKLTAPKVDINGKQIDYWFNIMADNSLGIKLNIHISRQKTILLQDSVLHQSYVSQMVNQTQHLEISKFISGINDDVTISSNSDIIKNVRLRNYIDTTIQYSYDIEQIEQSYHTSGFLSTFIMKSTGRNFKKYYISAASASISEQQVMMFNSTTPFNSPIEKIDNYGAFKINNSNDYYLPFINNNNLEFNRIADITCDGDNFDFASDPSQSVIFFLCKEKVWKYKYLFTKNEKSSDIQKAFISQKQLLILNGTYFSNLACIKGNLLIYNQTNIASYDYINDLYSEHIIQVSKIGGDCGQTLILFSESYFIYQKCNEDRYLSQHSYGQFKQTTSIFMRNIDLFGHFIFSLNFDAKRNDVEQLIAHYDDSDYMIIRVNDFSTKQNYTQLPRIQHFYGERQVYLINDDLLCILYTESKCFQLLRRPSIAYELNLHNNTFKNNLQFNAEITLSIDDADETKQKYSLQIFRDASTNNGIVNQTHVSLQQLRYQFEQPISVVKPYVLDDSLIYNSCLLGWEIDQSDPYFLLKNRLKKSSTVTEKIPQSILYNNLTAYLKSGSITIGQGIGIIKSDFFTKDCRVYGDQGSVKETQYSLNITLFVLCPRLIFSYNLKFTLSDNGQYTNFTQNWQNSKLIRSFRPNEYITRIITVSNSQYFYDDYNSQSWAFQEDNRLEPISKSPVIPISHNRINQLKSYLAFLQNGIIYVYQENNRNSIASLKDLLNSALFQVSIEDTVAFVQQQSDNLFLVQFKDSFAYQITFGLNQINELIILEAQQFYYRDALFSIKYGITGKNHTLFYGQKHERSKYTFGFVLYDTNRSQNRQNLIQSSIDIAQLDQNRVSSGQFLTDNSVQISFNDGTQILIDILENISLISTRESAHFNKEGIKITLSPTGIATPLEEQSIRLAIKKYEQQTDKDIISTYSPSYQFRIFIFVLTTMTILA